MWSSVKKTGKLLKTSFKAWNQKDPFRQSAVIAYYAIFSIPGLLVLVMAIAANFFGEEAVNERILLAVTKMMGADASVQINEILANAGQSKSTLVGSIIGIIVMLAGATGVFVELQKTLNLIWEVKAIPQKSILVLLKSRLFSFGIIMAIAFLLLISMVISTILAAFSSWIQGDASGFMVTLLKTLNFIISLGVISILFGLIYKILPDAKIQWKHVWLGSVAAGILFTIGKTALAFYFGKAQPASVYGAAGSIIIILLWVSYSSMIVFFGAELTAAYAKMYSGTVPPTELARADTHAKTSQAI